jgi:hypothetical protein
MEDRGERLGLNEALFREVNERVKSINDGFGTRLEAAEFVCECGNDECAVRVRIPLSEYEELRSDPTHFAVKDGHEILDVESVVRRCDDYVVVEKKAGAPAAVARETDPRS